MNISEKVSSALNINFSEDDAKNYPEFLQLLGTLTEKLNKQCLTTETEKFLAQSKDEVKHSKSKWLMQLALYHELKELLRDFEIASLDTALSTQYSQFSTILKESLTLAEVTSQLQCCPDPSNKNTLLGLKVEDLLQGNPHRKHLASVQQKLIPDLEHRLRKKCERVMSFKDIDTEEDDGGTSFDRSAEIADLIEREKHELKELKQKLQSLSSVKEVKFWTCCKTLTECSRILKVMTSHRLGYQVEQDTESLLAKCDALCLKIKLLEHQVLCDTYSKETVKALLCVRTQLDMATRDYEKELQHLPQALKSYESVGAEFSSLVEEYRKLKEEVENKQWALAELQRKGDNPK